MELAASAAKKLITVQIVMIQEISSLMDLETVNANLHIIYQLMSVYYVRKILSFV